VAAPHFPDISPFARPLGNTTRAGGKSNTFCCPSMQKKKKNRGLTTAIVTLQYNRYSTPHRSGVGSCRLTGTRLWNSPYRDTTCLGRPPREPEDLCDTSEWTGPKVPEGEGEKKVLRLLPAAQGCDLDRLFPPPVVSLVRQCLESHRGEREYTHTVMSTVYCRRHVQTRDLRS
jgi:hypothetical protein